VRRAAVEALIKVGGERAEKPLAELRSREQDAAIRETVDKALKRMTRQEALAAHWSFDDKNEKVAKDVTGHGNDGEIKGCAVAEGKVGAALRFGKGKFIELGHPAALTIAGKPFTIMAWAKSDAPNGVVVARGGAFCGYSLHLKDGTPRFGIRLARDGPALIAASRETVGGGWVHLAGVVRADGIELYVNGKLAGTAASRSLFASNCGQGMEIGCDAGNSAVEVTDPFEGVIDEVKQFDAALTEKEIAKQGHSTE
jgi:hypothetical protein